MLCLYGYTNQQADGLSFPDDVQEPDIQKVSSITLEVMSLRMELDMLIQVWIFSESLSVCVELTYGWCFYLIVCVVSVSLLKQFFFSVQRSLIPIQSSLRHWFHQYFNR